MGTAPWITLGQSFTSGAGNTQDITMTLAAPHAPIPGESLYLAATEQTSYPFPTPTHGSVIGPINVTTQAAVAWCSITTTRIAGISIMVDIATVCTGTDWTLDYRFTSSGLVATHRQTLPCGAQDHVEILPTPAVSDLNMTGWIYNATRRVDCAVY
jgi:hypothetical protein